MSEYAKKFIESKYSEVKKESSLDFTSVSVRFEPQNALMLKALSTSLKFSISVSFTDLISKNLADMVLCLDPEKLNKLKEKYNGIASEDCSALHILQKKEIIKPFKWDFG